MKKQYLESGKIVGTHGIKGEVRIDPWCDSPQFLAAFDKLYLDDRGETFIEVKSRPHKNITLCKIKGVDNIDDAQRLRGRIVGKIERHRRTRVIVLAHDYAPDRRRDVLGLHYVH